MSDSDDFAFSDPSIADEDSDFDVPLVPTPKKSASSSAKKDVKSKSGSAKKPVAAKTAGGKKIEDIYQRKSQMEHILLRPDTYIGSVESAAVPMWVVDEDKKFVFRTVNFVPGLFKIFDEILVNAADNKIRDGSMDTIKVTIDKENGMISVMNNGRGIPVQIHEKEQIYVPELIFGHLLTSSNYDDDEKKVTGGRNGYGAKLCNIFSTEFKVETSDQSTGKLFKQTFSANMSKRTAPKILKAAKKDYTKISFIPDWAKFGMEKMDDDLLAVLRKRVYDMAGVVKDVKVYLNDERIQIKNFKEYVKLYLESLFGEDGAKPTIVYECPDERWEICFAPSDGQFQQVSFVNSICTFKGGTHVNAVADQIVQKLNEMIKKKNKGNPLKPHQVKSHMFLFINCLIENPSFDSQTKENMTLKAGKFGSKCNLSDDFMKKVARSGVLENIMALAMTKQANQLKQTDGKKRARLSGIAKLDDANNAGTKNAKKCTLILTEGDSAKALAISGLSVVGRDNYGVFPLRGKLLNVREATHKQIMENAEINSIKQILGLKADKEYTSTDTLRYGHVMIMADQDHDGSHIKGLIINLFDHFWPSLLKTPNFLLQFITPIIRVTKGTRQINFYNLPEYMTWRETNDDRGWTIKYYKGLGTSTAADAKKYFSNMAAHMKPFARARDDDRQLIELAFSKKRADDRKEWLANLAAGTFIDHTVKEIPINDFVNRELILFSMADNVRSIPSLVDGCKPGQRKIIFSCFKRNLTKGELKVAQLAGYVSEHSAYHHGEASLQSTIIGLAQDFVGSNNVNLLDPRGQFGTRLQGGKDHAHARYIFTRLSSVTRLLFHPSDDKLLSYLNEENMSIEPEWYIPVIPTVLVNGAEGIGTGWSTSLPNYNPRAIVGNLRRKLDGLDFQPLDPWYRGFKGTIERTGDRYKISGIFRKVDNNTVEITELPVGSWTQTYKEFLEVQLVGTEKVQPSIKDYKEYHTDTSVHFVVELSDEQMAKAEAEGLEKKFRMVSYKLISNMVLFDKDGRLRKYNSPEEIMLEFYDLRLDFYDKRKTWLAATLTRELLKLSNQVRFILEVIEGTLKVQNRKRSDIIQDLVDRNYDPSHKLSDKDLTPSDAEMDVSEEAVQEEETEKSDKLDYNYLLSMPIWNLTMEKVQKMTNDRDQKQQELEILLATDAKDLWRADLCAFLEEWDRVENEVTTSNAPTSKKRSKTPAVDLISAQNAKKRKSLFGQKNNKESTPESDESDSDYMEISVKSAKVTAESVPAKPRPSRKATTLPKTSTSTSKSPKDVSPSPPSREKTIIQAGPAPTITIDLDEIDEDGRKENSPDHVSSTAKRVKPEERHIPVSPSSIAILSNNNASSRRVHKMLAKDSPATPRLTKSAQSNASSRLDDDPFGFDEIGPSVKTKSAGKQSYITDLFAKRPTTSPADRPPETPKLTKRKVTQVISLDDDSEDEYIPMSHPKKTKR